MSGSANAIGEDREAEDDGQSSHHNYDITERERDSLQVCTVWGHLLPARGLHRCRRSRCSAHPHPRRPDVEPLVGSRIWTQSKDDWIFSSFGYFSDGYLVSGTKPVETTIRCFEIEVFKFPPRSIFSVRFFSQQQSIILTSSLSLLEHYFRREKKKLKAGSASRSHD